MKVAVGRSKALDRDVPDFPLFLFFLLYAGIMMLCVAISTNSVVNSRPWFLLRAFF